MGEKRRRGASEEERGRFERQVRPSSRAKLNEAVRLLSSLCSTERTKRLIVLYREKRSTDHSSDFSQPTSPFHHHSSSGTTSSAALLDPQSQNSSLLDSSAAFLTSSFLTLDLRASSWSTSRRSFGSCTRTMTGGGRMRGGLACEALSAARLTVRNCEGRWSV